MVSVGQTPGGNSELLQKILASSPAAVAAEFVREERTAEVYRVLEDTCELLHKERHERVRAEECLADVVKELQDKDPAILRQEWESAIHANQATNSKLEAALAEMQTLRGQVKEIKAQRDRTMQDTASLERHNGDSQAAGRARCRQAVAGWQTADAVRDAVSMWQNVHVIHAFRALDEFAREQAHFRRVVLGFRRRTPTSPGARRSPPPPPR